MNDQLEISGQNFSFAKWCDKYKLDGGKAAIALGLSRSQSYKIIGEQQGGQGTPLLSLHCAAIDELGFEGAQELIYKRILNLSSPQARKKLVNDFNFAQWFNKYHLDVSESTAVVLGNSKATIYAYLNNSRSPSLSMVLHCLAIDALGHDEANILIVRRKMAAKQL